MRAVAMYEKFIRGLKSQFPEFPSSPDLDLGLAIKQIRLRMGMTQDELARNSGIKLSALKTLENGYSKFTKISNIDAIARVLRANMRDIILEAREWYPGNFFVMKLAEPASAGARKRKRREDIWFKRSSFFHGGFRLDFSSPPVNSPDHFHFMVADVEAGKQIPEMKLPYPNQVAGFVQRGTLKIVYDSGQEAHLFGNQGFSLRGDKTHSFINTDRDNPLRFCMVFSLSPSGTPGPLKTKPRGSGLSVGKAIHGIRKLYSDSGTRLLTFAELSYLTGLDEKSLQYLENTTEADQVVYWDKIEKITRALGMPFQRFLDLAEGKDEGYFHLATAHDRALIDYHHYLGVRIKSTLFPGTHNHYHMSEMYIEPKGGIRRVTWRRSDQAMIAVYLEDGELLVEVGKNRKAFLTAGSSVYFDGSLGYIFTNPGAKPSKLFIATRPPIVF